VGRARRRLSCFLITLSCSRALYLEFFFDQTLDNLLRGHVHAFQSWSSVPRIVLYDNMRSVSALGQEGIPEPWLKRWPKNKPDFFLCRPIGSKPIWLFLLTLEKPSTSAST
jgi:hypothetical protein